MTKLLALSLTTLFVIGCGKNSGFSGPTVQGTANIRLGSAKTSRAVPQPARAVGDHWRLSPNKAKVTFTKLTFFTDSGSGDVALSNCTVTYDRSASSGSSLLTCPVAIPQGTISRVQLYTSPTFDILVSDSVNNIYTTPAGFATTGPADFMTITSQAQATNNGDFQSDAFLPTPKVVAAGDTPTLNIVTDMVHSVFATVGSDGKLAFDSQDLHAPVHVFPTFTEPGKTEFWTEAATGESLNTQGGTSEQQARVFYFADGTPGFVSHDYLQGCAEGNYPTQAAAANPAKLGNGNKAGGYLGLDTTQHILSWALPVDFTYAAYRSVIELTHGATPALGDAATVKCLAFFNNTNPSGSGTAPVPASGDVYSTAPSLGASPVTSATLHLRAN